MRQIDVAIAVIHFGEHYLLGYRDAKKHQGNRYEFIGGKIEHSEKPIQALIREVEEEIGLSIKNNTINFMGVVTHKYQADKTLDSSIKSKSKQMDKSNKLSAKDLEIHLHVFRVVLSHLQFIRYKDVKKGQEGQKLLWVNKKNLIANKYKLPEANKFILEMLDTDSF